MMKTIVAIVILAIFVGGAITMAAILPREPRVDIGDGPAYAYNVDALLAQQEQEAALSINPQILGSIDITDTTTLPDGTVIHAGGDRWTLTCTFLTYRQERTRDMNGYASWAGLHWGVYELVQTSTPVAMTVNGEKWEFGFTKGYPQQFIVCSKELDQYMIQRISPGRDAGAYWYDTFTNAGGNIWQSIPNILHDPQIVTFYEWTLLGDRVPTKADLHDSNDWWWDGLSTVFVYSIGEPTTVRVGAATDFAGNPIQGLPDIGAFEWEPGLP